MFLGEMDFQAPFAGEGLVAIVTRESPSSVNVLPVNVESADRGEGFAAHVATKLVALVSRRNVAFEISSLERFPTKWTHLLLENTTLKIVAFSCS